MINVPFATNYLVIALSILLDGNISQMNLRILDFCLVISTMSESCKPTSIEVDSEGRVADYKSIETNVKLLIPNEKGIVYILLYDVGLCGMILPLGDL